MHKPTALKWREKNKGMVEHTLVAHEDRLGRSAAAHTSTMAGQVGIDHQETELGAASQPCLDMQPSAFTSFTPTVAGSSA
jgi:hypothetical protein